MCVCVCVCVCVCECVCVHVCIIYMHNNPAYGMISTVILLNSVYHNITISNSETIISMGIIGYYPFRGHLQRQAPPGRDIQCWTVWQA